MNGSIVVGPEDGYAVRQEIRYSLGPGVLYVGDDRTPIPTTGFRMNIILDDAEPDDAEST